MAHFAQIDPKDNNRVVQVIVVSNADCLDRKGNESEAVGAKFCHDNFGGTWKQTSYNRRIRVNYAVIGGHFNEEHDMFIPQSPFPSWNFDYSLNEWVPPIPMPLVEPSGSFYVWSEENLNWSLATINDD